MTASASASTAVPRPPPSIIQGGMGVAVSSWPLARAVSQAGQLGVVSGTALDVVVARRLQDGDPGGAPAPRVGRASRSRPWPRRVLDTYFRPEGQRRRRAATAPCRCSPSRRRSRSRS